MADWPQFETLGDLVRAAEPDLLLHTNALRRDVETLPPFRGFHVIRDPRDLIVSGYFSHLYSHPTQDWSELREHRRELRLLDLVDGLRSEIDWSAQFIDNMSDWDYQQPDVLEMAMEELVDDPAAGWTAILRHLGILSRLPDGLLGEVLENRAFQRLAGGRPRGQENRGHHYRRGIPGDWRNYLTPVHLAAIQRRYGDLVARLGYES
jgi:hypothetical protein